MIRRSIAEFLISQGVDVNKKNDLDSSPLHWAAISQGPDTLRVLLKAGALIDTVTSEGDSVLHFAVTNKMHGARLAEVLLDAGANILPDMRG